MNTLTRVTTLLEEQPALHLWGNGKARGHQIDFDAAREELTSPSTLRKIERAENWCSIHLVPAKPNPRDASTYGWKHVFERHTNLYIPNGAFAVAAALAGIRMNWARYNPTVHARESRHNPISTDRCLEGGRP